MSHLSQRLRRSALACVLLGTAIGVTAGPASAASLSAPSKCKFPLIGTVPATLVASADLPTAADAGTQIPPTSLSVKVAFPDTRGTGLAISDGFRAAGEINLRLAVKSGSGASATVNLAAPITPIEVPTNNTTGYLPFDLAGTATLPAVSVGDGGPTTIDVLSFIPNLRFSDLNGQPLGTRTPTTGVDREPFTDSDGDPATADVPCRFEPATPSVNLATIDELPICLPVINPPETPVVVPFGAGDVGTTSVHLRWSKPPVPPCGTPTESFRITYGNNKTVTVPATQTDVVIEGLTSFTDYTFKIEALDQWGFASQPLTVSAKTRAVICTADIKPPPAPVVAALTDADVTPTSVRLRWQPGEVGECPRSAATGYVVRYNGKTVTVPLTQTELVINELAPSTAYEILIGAYAEIPDFASFSLVNVTTDPGSTGANIKFAYSLKGSTQLKTLTKGTLQLSGGIAADFVPLTGAFTADLTLNDTSGRLVAAGFLPVTAKIGFAPSGKTTGTLLDGVLKTNSKVRIKVKEVKLFGAIPLAGGNNCQTRSLSDINLQSTQAEFDPLLGGPIAGTYKISDLNGCGALNGLVSPLTAGGGNTINLNLAPKPVAS